MPVIINGTTGVSGVDGSASTPAFQGTDTNTGISFGTDTVTINTGGVARVTTDANGNVGIGISTPTLNTSGTVLHINNSTASRAAIVHMTNAETGSAGSDGLIVGKWTDGVSYLFEYDNNPIIFGTNSTEAGRFSPEGYFLLGTTTSNVAKLGLAFNNATIIGSKFYHLSSTYSNAAIEFINHASSRVGYIYSTSTATTYSTTSDYRLKENVQPMIGALATVAQLKPCTYTWKANGESGQGFIAHELQAVVPDCVSGKKDDVDEGGNPKYQGVDTSFLVATLTAAIQELKAELDSVKSELATLKAGA